MLALDTVYPAWCPPRMNKRSTEFEKNDMTVAHDAATCLEPESSAYPTQSLSKDTSKPASPVDDDITDREKRRKDFPWKLHIMLSEAETEGNEDIVAWSPCGTAFRVYKPEEFLEKIMPRYFNQTQFRSFQRMLNLYNFQKSSGGPPGGEYSHPQFQRGDKERCLSMRIRTRSTSTKRRISDPNILSLNSKIEALSPTSGFGDRGHQIRSSSTGSVGLQNFPLVGAPNGLSMAQMQMLPGNWNVGTLNTELAYEAQRLQAFNAGITSGANSMDRVWEAGGKIKSAMKSEQRALNTPAIPTVAMEPVVNLNDLLQVDKTILPRPILEATPQTPSANLSPGSGVQTNHVALGSPTATVFDKPLIDQLEPTPFPPKRK